jgi:hypothetical protein
MTRISWLLSQSSPLGSVDLVEPAQTGAQDAAALRKMLTPLF